jgi:DNA segregation ATPase FtsK/SpoIIIE-like protein
MSSTETNNIHAVDNSHVGDEIDPNTRFDDVINGLQLSRTSIASLESLTTEQRREINEPILKAQLLLRAISKATSETAEAIGGTEPPTQSTPTAKPTGVEERQFAKQLIKAEAVVVEAQKASVSMVQRRLMIRYNLAARLMEALEIKGVVSVANEKGIRAVLKGG